MADRAAVAARRERVLQLRRTGLSFAAIAEAVHLPNARAAAQDVRRALAAQQNLLELTDAFTTTLENERLDAWSRHLEAVLQNASAGGDSAMVIRATGKLLEVQRMRLAMLGIEVEPAMPEPDDVDRIAQAAALKLITGTG
jgi:DNA-binding transcriptional MerR regulator